MRYRVNTVNMIVIQVKLSRQPKKTFEAWNVRQYGRRIMLKIEYVIIIIMFHVFG